MMKYDDISAHVDAGKTASEIADIINAEGRTHSDIELGALLYTLNFRGMLTKLVGNDAAKKWTGSVLNMAAAVEASGDTAAIANINVWLSHVTNPRNTHWRTTRAEYAAPFFALYNAFRNPPNSAIFQPGDLDAIYELGGGRITTTETAVQQLIDDHETEATRETLEADWTTQQNDAGINAAIASGDRGELVASLRLAADALEV